MKNKNIEWQDYSAANLKKLIRLLDLKITYTTKNETVGILYDLDVDSGRFEEVCRQHKILPLKSTKKSRSKAKKIPPPPASTPPSTSPPASPSMSHWTSLSSLMGNTSFFMEPWLSLSSLTDENPFPFLTHTISSNIAWLYKILT